MGPYHVMLAHFPIALWSTAAAIVLLRFVSSGKVARAADGALSFILFLGVISGALTIAVGNRGICRCNQLFTLCVVTPHRKS